MILVVLFFGLIMAAVTSDNEDAAFIAVATLGLTVLLMWLKSLYLEERINKLERFGEDVNE